MANPRVLVTRAAHQAGKLSEGLRASGIEPVEVPVLEIVPPQSFDSLDAALRQIQNYNWLIFTSANTIPFFHARAKDLGIDLAQLELQVAAIGSATAQAIEQTLKLTVSLRPKEYVAESLVNALLLKAEDERSLKEHRVSRTANPNNIQGQGALKGNGFSSAITSEIKERASAPGAIFSGQRILIARAEVARDVIPDALRAAGAAVDVVDAYRNITPDLATPLLRAALELGIDAATFTSSSSVTHLADVARAARIAFPVQGVPAISIGPITSTTLRELGWEPAAEASPSDISGLVAAVRRFFGRP